MLKRILWSFYSVLGFVFSKRVTYPSVTRFSAINVILVGNIGIGDVLMLSPLVVLLRKNFAAKIAIVTEHVDYFSVSDVTWIKPEQFKPEPSSLLVAPTLAFGNIKYLTKCKYYLGYFFGDYLSGNISFEDHTIDHRYQHYFSRCFPILKALDCSYDKSSLQYPLLNSNPFELDFEGEYICFSPYVNWPARQYQLSSFASIIKAVLRESDLKVVLLGSSKKEEKSCISILKSHIPMSPRIFDYSGQMSIKQMIWVINNSKYFVGNDSGPLHASFLSNCMSIGVFGAISPNTRVPLSPKLRKKIKTFSSPDICRLFPCYDGFSEPKCRNSFYCTKEIDPRTIAREIS